MNSLPRNMLSTIENMFPAGENMNSLGHELRSTPENMCSAPENMRPTPENMNSAPGNTRSTRQEPPAKRAVPLAATGHPSEMPNNSSAPPWRMPRNQPTSHLVSEPGLCAEPRSRNRFPVALFIIPTIDRRVAMTFAAGPLRHAAGSQKHSTAAR